MKFVKDFFAGDAFFPVLLGLMLGLVLIFIWILLTGRKKFNKQTKKEEVVVNTEVIPANLPEEKPATIDNVEESTPVTTLDEVLVNIPINNMDDTPVDVFVPKEEINDIGETVEIETSAPLVESNVADDEIVDIEMPSKKFEDVGEFVTIDVEEGIVDEDMGEMVEIPVPKTLENEVGEAAVAFDTIPEANHIINESVKVETPVEYVGEKTEILDFPDFNNIEQSDDKKLTGNVEEDVIRAANEFIASIFKENEK